MVGKPWQKKAKRAPNESAGQELDGIGASGFVRGWQRLANPIFVGGIEGFAGGARLR